MAEEQPAAPKRGRGRPQAEIDLAELKRLCKLQCTLEEIAAFFEVTKQTIINYRKRPEFREVMENGRLQGLVSLRRAQFTNALKGNATMQVWLGKQWLGQKDRIASELSGPDGASLVPPVLQFNFVNPRTPDDSAPKG